MRQNAAEKIRAPGHGGGKMSEMQNNKHDKINDMKKIKRYNIYQIDATGNEIIIAKNVDIHYCVEICGYLKKIHDQFIFEYKPIK